MATSRALFVEIVNWIEDTQSKAGYPLHLKRASGTPQGKGRNTVLRVQCLETWAAVISGRRHSDILTDVLVHQPLPAGLPLHVYLGHGRQLLVGGRETH